MFIGIEVHCARMLSTIVHLCISAVGFCYIGYSEFEAAFVVHAHTQNIRRKVAPSYKPIKCSQYNAFSSSSTTDKNGLFVLAAACAAAAIYIEPYTRSERSLFIIFCMCMKNIHSL